MRKLRVYLGDLSAAFKVLSRGAPWAERRSKRKYQYSEGDMVTHYSHQYPKPFPTKTFRNGEWVDNK